MLVGRVTDLSSPDADPLLNGHLGSREQEGRAGRGGVTRGCKTAGQHNKVSNAALTCTLSLSHLPQPASILGIV